jgi:hypothetical protein
MGGFATLVFAAQHLCAQQIEDAKALSGDRRR